MLGPLKPLRFGALETMEKEMARDGFCLISEAGLATLSPGTHDSMERFLFLTSITRERGWSFEFEDELETVRFTKLADAVAA